MNVEFITAGLQEVYGCIVLSIESLMIVPIVSKFFNKISFYNIDTYKSSTCFLAQGVFRKKVKLDLMLGLLLKQLMRMSCPNSSHPK